MSRTHRRTLLRGDDDLLDVAERLDQSDAADHQRVLALTEITAAGIRVARGDRVEHLLQREVVRAQASRIDGHLVLLDAATPRHDVHDPRDLAELALERPVFERLQLHERHGLRLERVAVHLADHAGERPEPGLRVRRQLRLGDALLHLLPRPVVVGAVGEQDPDVRQAEVRERAEKRHVRDAVQLLLDLDRDVPFDFLGRVTGPERDDVDLDVRDVGIGLDGQPGERRDASRGQEECERQRDEPLVERERDHARHGPTSTT